MQQSKMNIENREIKEIRNMKIKAILDTSIWGNLIQGISHKSIGGHYYPTSSPGSHRKEVVLPDLRNQGHLTKWTTTNRPEPQGLCSPSQRWYLSRRKGEKCLLCSLLPPISCHWLNLAGSQLVRKPREESCLHYKGERERERERESARARASASERGMNLRAEADHHPQVSRKQRCKSRIEVCTGGNENRII